MAVSGAPSLNRAFGDEDDHIKHHRDLESGVNGGGGGGGGTTDGDLIIFDPVGTVGSTNVQAAIAELDGDIQGHITDTTAAHMAASIGADSATLVGVGTTVQAVFEELDDAIAAHIAQAVAVHAASAIANTPAGNIAATTVQAALNELDAEKLAGAHTQLASTITDFAAATYAAPQPQSASQSVSFTPDLTMAGQYIILNKATPATVTIPLNATVAFPVGQWLWFKTEGAGAWTFSPAGGVTINPQPNVVGDPVTLAPGAIVGFYKRATNTWDYVGSVVTREPRSVSVYLTGPTETLTTASVASFVVPIVLNGYDLVGVKAFLTNAQSSSGIPRFILTRLRGTAAMLSTKLTVDASEADSTTAATPAVIDTTKDDVVTNDVITVSSDVSGTGAKGVIIVLEFA